MINSGLLMKGNIQMGSHAKFQHRLHEIIFEADTRAGKWFDILLIFSILMSVVVVMVDSMASIRAVYGDWFMAAEWGFTLLFTTEYLLRLFCVQKPFKYVTSAFGIVDLLAILPTYISFFLPGSQYLVVIRVLRVLRIFRVLKLVQYLGEASVLSRALKASRRKIVVFFNHGDDLGGDLWIRHVSHRRRGKWIYQYPQKHILGHCDNDHRGIRGYCPPNRLGPSPGSRDHDSGLWDHCCAHGNCHL